jgi:hypothetical protein
MALKAAPLECTHRETARRKDFWMAIFAANRVTAGPYRATYLAVVSATLLLSEGSSASAQSLNPFGTQSAPIVGQTSGITPLPTLPNFGGNLVGTPERHYTPTKAPCIKVTPEAAPQKVNPRIYDNFLIITNDCGQTIGLQACYYQKKGCLDVEIRGYARKEVILGIQFDGKEFRYEYRENFN